MLQSINHFWLFGKLMYNSSLSGGGGDSTLACICNSDSRVRRKIIKQCHDALTSGHFGTFKTYELLAN